MFQALRFPPGGPVSLLLWSCCLFHVTVSQNLKCLWDHEVIGVSCVLRMAHVTVVCTFETCINQKSVIYLFIICGVIAALEALIGLRHTIFFFFCTHTFSCSTPTAVKAIFMRGWIWVSVLCLLLVPVIGVKAVCVCQSMLMIKSMWIHFKAIKSSGYCWCSRVQ